MLPIRLLRDDDPILLRSIAGAEVDAGGVVAAGDDGGDAVDAEGVPVAVGDLPGSARCRLAWLDCCCLWWWWRTGCCRWRGVCQLFG